MTKPIYDLLTVSLIDDYFPKIFKETIISKLRKSRSKLLANNYRPIILSNISKIFEKKIRIHLMKYLVNNNQHEIRMGCFGTCKDKNLNLIESDQRFTVDI